MSNSLQPHRLYSPCDSPGQNTRVGSCSLLQGIFPTQGSNQGLLHYKWILYQLSRQGSPRILEWVAYPFPRQPSPPRNQTRVSCIADGFFYWLSYQGSPFRILIDDINILLVLQIHNFNLTFIFFFLLTTLNYL